MRKLLLAAAFAAFAPFAVSDDKVPAAKIQEPKQAEKKKQEVTLKVGDPAPKLKADKWLQGAEVNAFEPSKVYVVEFWATWCGPCIAMMPHMADLQAEYRDKGVTFIGFAAKDPTSNLEAVSALVKKRGPKLGYTFAFADNRDTYTDWMTAAGQNGIPCSYVVDKAGKIAYIGHPMLLDFVLPKVVAGEWTEADAKTATEIQKEISEVFKANGDKDPEVGLKALADLNKKYPWTASIPYFVGPKIVKLAMAKKNDEAAQFAKAVLAKAVKNEDTSMLGSLAFQLRAPGAKEIAELAALAVQAAEANLKIAGDADFNALMIVTDTHFTVGDKAKAKECVAKAVAAAKTPVQLAGTLRSPAVKDNKEVLGDILKAAEANLQKAGDTDSALMLVADSHFALGDKAKAKEFGEKAVAAAKTPQMKAALENRVKRFEDDK